MSGSFAPDGAAERTARHDRAAGARSGSYDFAM